ncbi:hypothetical protein clg_29 [Corynebacterium phage CL31]|nr:hypothetical protein clg_29 [Corynebacterium phage CL31]
MSAAFFFACSNSCFSIVRSNIFAPFSYRPGQDRKKPIEVSRLGAVLVFCDMYSPLIPCFELI